MSCTEHTEGEIQTTDMQTKLLMAAIEDILATSKSLSEAHERFKQMTNAAGILLAESTDALTPPPQTASNSWRSDVILYF